MQINSMHPAIKEAMDLVTSTRLPLLYSEVREIMQGVWDAAFREGASQGRKAGIEAVQHRLREIAAETTDIRVKELLLSIADSYDSPHAEYKDPTTAIRERLAARRL